MFQDLLKYIVSMQRPRYYEEKNWNVIVCIERVFLLLSFFHDFEYWIDLLWSWRFLVHVANSQNSASHGLASPRKDPKLTVLWLRSD